MAQQSYSITNQQVSPDVSQQAATYQLGQLTSIYKPRFSNPFAILGIVLGVIILDIIVLLALDYFTDRLFIYLLIVPILMIIFGASTLPHCNLRVYTFTEGFIQGKGKNLEPARWEHVDAFWEDITQNRRSISYKYTVHRTDGKTFVFPNALQKVVQLGTIIKKEIVKIQLPRVIESYNAGQSIAFGQVNVTMQGLNNGKEIVPWDQVGSIVVRGNILNIEKDGRMLKWSSIKASTVPNLNVLVGLVNHVVTNRGN
jgi:hypothetical protein